MTTIQCAFVRKNKHSVDEKKNKSPTKRCKKHQRGGERRKNKQKTAKRNAQSKLLCNVQTIVTQTDISKTSSDNPKPKFSPKQLD